MSQMTLAIPEDVVSALRLPPDEMESELRKELAVALYQRRVLPLAKAATLAQMTRWEFEELLCDRHIERPFSDEDLAEDLKFAREVSPKTTEFSDGRPKSCRCPPGLIPKLRWPRKSARATKTNGSDS